MANLDASGAGIYDDFPGYRAYAEGELDEALRSALIVIDANVLLSLYRYNESARHDLINVLIHVGDRLWVPHQALREFWRNRIDVLMSRGAQVNETLEALGKQRRSTIDAVNRWARTTTAIDASEANPLVDRITAFYTQLENDVRRRSPAAEPLANIAAEPVILQLEKLLRNKVGRAQNQSDWEAAVKRGAERIKRKQPPGYLDAEKADSNLPEGASGDYLVWDQTISEATRRDSDVLLVTGDEKEDWWRRFRSEFLGPRPELIDELKEKCGHKLYMMRPADLLRHAPALQVTVNSRSVEDVERVARESIQRDMFGRDQAVWNELIDAGLNYLIEVASNQSIITYTELNDTLKYRVGSGFDFDRADERGALGHLLGLIVERNYPETNLMISALVTYIGSNDPGPGFYRLAQELGLLRRGVPTSKKLEFWMNQVKSLHAYYLPSARSS